MSSELQKLRYAKVWRYSQLNAIRGIARYHSAGSMALLRYFSKMSKVEKLSDPKERLLEHTIVRNLFH